MYFNNVDLVATNIESLKHRHSGWSQRCSVQPRTRSPTCGSETSDCVVDDAPAPSASGYPVGATPVALVPVRTAGNCKCRVDLAASRWSIRNCDMLQPAYPHAWGRTFTLSRLYSQVACFLRRTTGCHHRWIQEVVRWLPAFFGRYTISETPMGELVTGWIIQQDGGIAHAVDSDDTTKTVCGDEPVDVTADAWLVAPTPRCVRCLGRLAQHGRTRRPFT